ncbi:hypothetical protein B0H13DRAFT_1952848 [Mycena leptocephala]|nr:hypothetical protein B0H13DRAFT_1952848 [Mycena leptocephala]
MRARMHLEHCVEVPPSTEMPSRTLDSKAACQPLSSISQTSHRWPFDRGRLAGDCDFMYLPSCPALPVRLLLGYPKALMPASVSAQPHASPSSARPHRLAVPPNGFTLPPSNQHEIMAIDFFYGFPAPPSRNLDEAALARIAGGYSAHLAIDRSWEQPPGPQHPWRVPLDIAVDKVDGVDKE